MSIKSKVAAAFGLNVLVWLAMWVVFAGLMFCAAGAYMALAARIAPASAALIVGGGLIALIALIALVALVVARPKKLGATASRENPDNMLEQQLRPVVGERATNWAKDNTGLALVGALSAGVIVAASPGLRRTISRALMPVITRKAIRTIQDFSDND